MEILGVKIDNFSEKQALSKIEDFLRDKKQRFIATPNPEMLAEAERDWFFKQALGRADLAPADGFGLVLAGRYLFGEKLNRLAGADLMKKICEIAGRENKSVYLVGGGEGVAEAAGKSLGKKYSGLRIVGAERGIEMNPNPKLKTDLKSEIPKTFNFSDTQYLIGLNFDQDENRRLLERIRAASPDVLFVAFGHGKQEKWLAEFLPRLPSVRIAMGVGGAFDYLSGKVRRAPGWLCQAGLEWLWRLALQPWRIKRIWRAVIGFSLLVKDYKKQIRLPYRQGVVGFVMNDCGEFFLGRRRSSALDYYFFNFDHWQPPQGGIDAGETAEQAVLREIREETGLSGLEIISRCREIHQYDWSVNFMRKKGLGYRFRGQQKTIFLLKYKGDGSDIKIDHQEMDDYKWVSLGEMKRMIHPFRRRSLEILMKEGVKRGNFMAKSNPKIRVRFAPSPTGFLHVGSLRTALYNYLFARQKGGDFILRVEDTDRARTVPGAVEGLLKILKAVGLEWDEGPYLEIKNQKPKVKNSNIIKEKGDFGPYIQSHRLDIYRKYAEELVEKGRAYYCFCSEEKLEKMRKTQELNKQPTMYDGFCRNPNSELRIKNLKFGKPFVIRLAVPKEGITRFNDLIRGQVEFENKLIDDQILLKSDGYPTYHLANAVDDHLMKISHVIRGEEWLSSAPKHVLLHEAFGWEPPQFAHISLLLNPDRSKLSKRQGDVAVEDFLKKGYLPETLLNFAALLGWSSAREPDSEIFSLKELIKEFSLERISPSGAVFNLEKLDWLNGHYIRQKPAGELVELCLPYLERAGLVKEQRAKTEKIIVLERERLKKLSDISESAEFFFKKPEYSPKLLVWRKSDGETARRRLERLLTFYDAWPEKRWDKNALKNGTLEMIKKENLDNGATLWPMRAALSGRQFSPGPFEIADILGKEETLERLKTAVKKMS